MRKITTCLLLVLLSCATVSKEVSRELISNPDGTKEYVFYSDEKEITKQIVKGGRVIKTIGKIPDGIVKEYYKSEKLKAEWNYKNNKLEGLSKQYFESGKLMTESNLKDGKAEGLSKRYYENGKLFVVSNYKDGKEEGKCMMYDENGMLFSELHYRNNKLDGITNIYDESGKIRVIENYENGKRTKRKEYDEKGNLRFEKNDTMDKEKK